MTAPDHMPKAFKGTCMKRGIHTWSLRSTRGGSVPQILSFDQDEDDEHDHDSGGGERSDKRADDRLDDVERPARLRLDHDRNGLSLLSFCRRAISGRARGR